MIGHRTTKISVSDHTDIDKLTKFSSVIIMITMIRGKLNLLLQHIKAVKLAPKFTN